MRRSIFLLTALMGVCLPAWAGAKELTLRQRVADPNNQTREFTQYWTDNKTVTDDPLRRMIIDFAAKTIVTVDKNNKTYTTMTFDEMQQRAAALQKQLHDLPLATQQQMGDIFDDSPVTLKPTGKSEKIAGYAATEYTIEGNRINGKVWITDAFDVSPHLREWQKTAAGKSPADRIAAAVAGIKGLPLRQGTAISNGPVTYTSVMEVLELSEKAPPADVLKVPDGFTKASVSPAGK